MTETPPVPASPLSRVAAGTAALLWLVVVTGLFFHHSARPVVLGRFSKTYALGLLACALVTPLLFLVTRSLLAPSLVTRRDGTTFAVSPSIKILVVSLSSVLVFGVAQLFSSARPWKFQPHAYLQAVPAPNAAWGVNSRGFRGGEPALPKPADVFRVVLLGGSTTFDPDLAYEASYGRQLELALGRALVPKRVDVQCAGAPAYNSAQSLIRYATDAIELDADVVLVMHAVNDLYAAGRSPAVFRRDYGHMLMTGPLLLRSGFRDRTPLTGTIRFFFNRVLFSDFRAYEIFDAEGVLPDAGPLARNLRSIAVLGKSRGQRVVLCTQPHTYRLDLPAEQQARGEKALKGFFNGEPLPGFAWYSRYMKIFNERVRAVAAEEGLALLDFERDVPPSDALFLDSVHVTAEGARLEARLAAEFLVGKGLTR